MIAGLPARKGHCCVRAQFPHRSLSAFGFDAEARTLVHARRHPALNPASLPAVNQSSGARIQADAPDERKHRND
jgi:hypothetical protein